MIFIDKIIKFIINTIKLFYNKINFIVEVPGPKIIDRSIVQKNLEKAINSTCERFSNFCGILIYGSFVREEKPFGDIDIIPVLYRYNDNWDFSSLCEDYSEHNQDYYDYQKIEEYLGGQMYPLPQGFDKPIKYNLKDKGLLHISGNPGLIALDRPDLIKERLNGWNVNPETFIGKEEVRLTIENILRNSY
ncbi:hypothetical protein HGA92_04910 [Candidatus Gracilibacteria bacterium]|nr:hypothetical protein [Candidatus Gracilibacteria bacterium]NUJ98425.1 hypothetical protein [Candidatus Gracilibacteria bacterium]